MILTFTEENIWTSDECDVQPETLEVIYDPAVVEKAHALIKERPWIESVTFNEGVDFNVDEAYDGKARNGRILVDCIKSVYFKFTNDWTGTTYTVDLSEVEIPEGLL